MASSFPEPPPSPPSADSSDAERRLSEAEDRLREAIEELQRRQRRAAACGPQHHPPCHHASDESCVANAIGNLCQSFLLSYGVRVGIGILLRAFKLARRQSYSSLLDLKVLVLLCWNWAWLWLIEISCLWFWLWWLVLCVERSVRKEDIILGFWSWGTSIIAWIEVGYSNFLLLYR